MGPLWTLQAWNLWEGFVICLVAVNWPYGVHAAAAHGSPTSGTIDCHQLLPPVPRGTSIFHLIHNLYQQYFQPWSNYFHKYFLFWFNLFQKWSLRLSVDTSLVATQSINYNYLDCYQSTSMSWNAINEFQWVEMQSMNINELKCNQSFQWVEIHSINLNYLEPNQVSSKRFTCHSCIMKISHSP